MYYGCGDIPDNVPREFFWDFPSFEFPRVSHHQIGGATTNISLACAA